MKAALVALALLVVGCGAPSSFDLCNIGCDVQGRCVPGFTATQVQNCKQNCSNMSGTLSDDDKNCDRMCTNCAAVRTNLANCASKECSQISSCVQGVDQTCAVRQ